MGQIVSSAAKPKRCNANQLSQVLTPAAGEHILVSSDNSMNAAGQGNFDCYIVGDGTTAASELPLQDISNDKELMQMAEALVDVETNSFETPNVPTSTAGTSASGSWGNLLTNTESINVKRVRFYSSSTKTSFVIAIGVVNTSAKTYEITEKYTITANVSVGENTIDVSQYNIVIPPASLVVCTGATNYYGSSVDGVANMIKVTSTDVGTTGTYSRINALCLQFVLIDESVNYSLKDNHFASGETITGVSIQNNLRGGEHDVLSAEQGKELDAKFNEFTNSAFDVVVKNVSMPSTQTDVAGTAASGTWGNILENPTAINVQSVKFYAKAVNTSFVIAIGTIDAEAGTYTINESHTITASIVVGENTIDVSSYNIVVPSNAFVVCTGATNYGNSVDDAGNMYRVTSIEAGYSGAYTANRSDLCMKFSLIGTMSVYEAKIPDDVLEVALKSNVLYGKSYTSLGDSFTAGTTSYPNIIAARNDMTLRNQGQSGGTLNGYIAGGYHELIPSDVDYVTIWYGINDRGNNIEIGTVNDQPETIATNTSTSTCGGFNWIFKWLYTNRPFAKIGVIITDFCEQTRREAIIACCQKWGVAYLDLYDPTIPMIRTRGNTQYPHDTSIAPLGYVEVCDDAKTLRTSIFSTNPSTSNIHPNADCHEWQSTFIENFMRGL